MEETKKEEPDKELAIRLENAAARLEAANKRFEYNKVLAETERIEKNLQGKGEAGITPVVKEETPEEYKKRILRGG